MTFMAKINAIQYANSPFLLPFSVKISLRRPGARLCMQNMFHGHTKQSLSRGPVLLPVI